VGVQAVSEERIIHCDGPVNRYSDAEGDCPTHAKEGRAEWLRVRWGSKALDFCSWDCALAYGARIDPIEVVR
jgi:hypothetical protein